MSSLSIDKNIQSGEKVTFRVDLEFFGYSEIIEFSFNAPAAAPLLNRINTITLKKNPAPNRTKEKQTANFTRCFVGVNLDQGHYALKVLLNDKKKAGDFVAGEKIKFNAANPTGPLKNFHNKEFFVIKDTNKDARYIYLKVSKGIQPVGSIANASGSLTELGGTIKVFTYTVSLPSNFLKGLVSKISTATPKKIQVGDVEDIPIFAYLRFENNKKTTETKLLMVDKSPVNDKEPPNRNVVVPAYKNVLSFSQNFDFDEDEKFIFYVAIARYTYNGTGWDKEWLQTNSLGDVLWGRAKENSQ